LAAAIKHKVKNAVSYISNFETVIAHEAKKRHVDGLVCGHIHHAEISQINGVIYCNAGDWVESRTALVEHFDGSIELLRWSDVHSTTESLKLEPLRAAA
jgi:UDP-2,3-diacylglucosamine pyrophosphatase LpxH